MKIKEYWAVLAGAEPVFEYIKGSCPIFILKDRRFFKKFDFCTVGSNFRASNYFKVNER